MKVTYKINGKKLTTEFNFSSATAAAGFIAQVLRDGAKWAALK
jgi:hypothetical protein